MQDPVQRTAAPRRVLLASLVGTAVEFYDFFIYATAASLVFGPLFFPSSSRSAQLLASYATLALAFLARPLGAAIFGHFGDRIGRKATLVTSLLLMGVSTTLIAFLPTYAMVGWAAPLMLCVLRVGQGIGLGGEWGGAAILAVENAPASHRGRYGMVPQLGSPVGFLASNGVFLVIGILLTPEQFRAWGWRVPFLGSAVLVALGLWVRLKLTETPAFKAAMAEGPPPRVPFATLFAHHLPALATAMLGVVASFCLFYISTAFALGYGVGTLHYSQRSVLLVQMAAVLCYAAAIATSGWLTDRFGAHRVLLWGSGFAILVGFALAPLMLSGTLLGVFAFLSLALVTMGLIYGPLGSWLPGLFPPFVRYSGTALGFNLGGILGGSLTPLAAQALATHGGLRPVGYYLSAAATVSFVALIFGGRSHPPDAPEVVTVATP